MKKMTIVINLFGGPSIGKTVLAARLFGEMACNPVFGCVEQVNEYAKLLAWEKDHQTLGHQPTVTRGQIRNFAPVGHCDFIVTDSPLDLGLVYSPEDQLLETAVLIDDFRDERPHRDINILLRREREGFQTEGRVHNYDESIEKDRQIEQMLKERGKIYFEVSNMIDPTELSRMILQNHV